ncbi:MAG: hypothetical protein ACFFF4_10200 [Candidatus Thorarchaeota archaeon]
MKDDLSQSLGILGLKTSKGQESRIFTVLRAVLNVVDEHEDAVTFREIYESLQGERGFKSSKAWVHRILKHLVEMGLIRLEIPDAVRKRYIANIETVASGLDKMKIKNTEALEAQIHEIESQLDRVRDIDTAIVSQDLVKFLTGKQQVLSSRFIKGVEELHKVLEDHVHGPAGPGDIIRSTMSFGGPWTNEGAQLRGRKYFESARRGVDVRWLVDMKVWQSDEIARNFPVDLAARLIGEFVKLQNEGCKVEIRLYTGGVAYNQSSLNDDRVILIITEDPTTSTYVTRDFNSDLVDSVIKNFDEVWEKAIPMFGAKPEELKKLGLADTPYLMNLMQKIQEGQTE